MSAMDETPDLMPARGGQPVVSAARPVVLLETFDDTKSWDDWYSHFENVAAVNTWDNVQK